MKTKIIMSLLTIILVASSLQTFTSQAYYSNTGGYIDELVYSVIETTDAELLALRTNEIDLVGEQIEPEYLPSIIGEQNIQINSSERCAFGHISLNTQMFPTNITGFRVALAQALDKERISSEFWAGNAQPIDLPVPSIYGEWSIEADLPYNYYESDIAKANETLTNAGFVDTDGDGWREWDPDGDGVGADLNGDSIVDDDVTIDIPAAQDSTIATRICELAAANLVECGIKATASPTDFNSMLADYFSPPWGSGIIPAAFFAWGLSRLPDHLFDLWRTGQFYNTVTYLFSNATYDMHVDAMMAAVTREDAIFHARKCQEIFFEEMPLICCYQNLIYSAYRTDKFTGFVNAKGVGVFGGNAVWAGGWTPWKVRLKTGELGGTFRENLAQAPDYLNILNTASSYSMMILELIYDTLMHVDPNTWEDIPWISWNWTIETVYDSSLDQDVLKITHHLVQNATFHDGTPLTADDVVFSYDFINWSQSPFLIDDLLYWINTTKIDDYTVAIYSSSPSYFEFARVGDIYILPEHIWKNPATYGKESWDDVTPDDVVKGFTPTVDQMVGSGPFKMKEIVAGEYYVLETFINHPYSVRASPPGLSLGVDSSKDVTTGAPITYAVTIENTGVTALTNIVVVVSLVSGVELASGDLTTNIASLAAGTSQTVTLTLRATKDGTFTVSVDGEADFMLPVSASTSIKATTPPPYEWIGVGIVIVVLVVIAGYFATRKR